MHLYKLGVTQTVGTKAAVVQLGVTHDWEPRPLLASGSVSHMVRNQGHMFRTP